MFVLLVKDGVRFDRIAPAGFRILGALEQTVRRLQRSLTITCGTEGHPPNDPHSKGEAFDVRTHGLTDKHAVLREVMLNLADGDTMIDAPLETSIGLATIRFYGQIEHPGLPTEHFHFQRRRGATYP